MVDERFDEHVFEKLPEEHRKVRKLIISVDDTMGDLDAFFKLQTERFELSQVSTQALAEKSIELVRTVDDLFAGLKKHFEYEEEHLSRTLGNTLTKALKIEHADIARMIEFVRKTINETSFEGSTQAEMLAKKAFLQEVIGKLTDRLEAHARDEDVLLKWVRIATSKTDVV